MIKIAFLLAGLSLTVSIYTITETDIDGNSINFSNFQGKKILLVNTATNSAFVSQYAGLEQLYQQYKDSLVIIAFPSNSFGNEPGTNASIKSFVMSNYNIHYLLGSKINVAGSNLATIYQWLIQINQNGMMNSSVNGDFQKYLVDKDGTLIGEFSPLVLPMSSTIQNAITGN